MKVFASTIRTLPAHALFITIVVALIIGVICSMLILGAYNNLRFETDLHKVQVLDRNLQSAIDVVLSDTALITGPTQSVLDLFGDGKDSAFVKTDSWGLLSFANVKMSAGNKANSKAFFVGRQAPPAMRPCLYLAEHQTPLSLVGDTRLLGDAFLPKGGIRPAFIDGRGYIYKDFLKGQETNSNDTLPLIDARLLQSVVGLSELPIGENSQAKLIPDSLDRSFADTSFQLLSKGPIHFGANFFKGHILIKSDSSISVSRETRLENVILVAPVIKIDSGFSGNLQAIATQRIEVGSNCQITYPSALILLKQLKTTEQPTISIGDSCRISGTILAYTFKPDDLAKTKVELGKGCNMVGLIYTSGYLFLQGRVRGTVFADYLCYKTSTTVYINYLVDAVIDRNSLSQYFLGPPIFNNTEQNRVMAWLN
jgi:hypothetical protein